ncbi:hypothetical protein PABG_02383 [Paracoccidioides brasiliensis Pb03]|nr:hypothetical protein PABG_02383 [Paracoccidioides brasiliensis Pb03]
MRQSSEEKNPEEKTTREVLDAKERRRLQNRIAQRNHRRKKAQLSGYQQQKSKDCLAGLVDARTNLGNNVKFTQQAPERKCRNLLGSFTVSPSHPINKHDYCDVPGLDDECRLPSTLWSPDNQTESTNTHSRQHFQEVNEASGTAIATKVWEIPALPSEPSGVQSSQFPEDMRKSGYLVTNSPDFNVPFEGTDSEISSPAAQSYTGSLSVAQSCPTVPDSRTPVSEDGLSIIGIPPGWRGNIFDSPRRFRSYSENAGRFPHNSPFLVRPENYPELARDQDDSEGKMALHLSAKNGHANIVRCLLDFGSEINQQDMSGATALHYAAETGNVEVMKILLERGADGNITDLQGRTPLHIAAEKGHEAAVRVLIQSGARVDIQIQRKQVNQRYGT